MIEIGDTVRLPNGKLATVIGEKTHDEICRHLRVEIFSDESLEMYWSVESDFTLIKKGNKNGERTS